MRKCSQCNRRKPESEFYAHKQGRDGLRAECKICSGKYTKNYQQANPNRAKEWREENRHELKKKARERKLYEKYGITIMQYQDIYNDQDGLCAICKKEETAMSPRRIDPDEISLLSIDHCHKTGKIRGLLCSKCNKGIGLLCDDISILENAIRYISKHK